MIETIKYKVIEWLHITNPVENDFKYILDTYHFHPLDIDDCKSVKSLRPKVDIYIDYYFMNFHFPMFDKTNTFIEVRELKVFWGKNYLITLSKNHSGIKDLFDSEKNDSKMDVTCSDILLYNILDKLTKKTQNVVERVEDDVDECGRLIFNKKADKPIRRISITQKNIIALNTMFKPQLPLFSRLQNGSIEGFADNMGDYWGNILDHYQKIWDVIEDCGELIRGYSTTFDSLQVNKTNEVIKILTLISSVLLPITFIASLYGMNIDLPFQNNINSFGIITFGMISVVLLMAGYFKYKDWI